MLELLKDLWGFMKVRKKFWLAPIIIVLLLLGDVDGSIRHYRNALELLVERHAAQVRADAEEIGAARQEEGTGRQEEGTATKKGDAHTEKGACGEKEGAGSQDGAGS